ncbi:LppU/SCO3897 family protein [Nocardia spumae]|uniref:LppU/SCO3897 family protein n=1 Tax=Nocardia spumae TaxID=2887190 RepID=UPI001D13366A|nr:hypothetical protein [Nocardia spumae]
MSRRRVQAGVTLTGFVIAAALSAACLIAAALSFTANRHGSDETHTAATQVVRSTSAVPVAAETPAASPSAAATSAHPEEPLVLNKGADEKHPAEPVAVGDCVAGLVAPAPDGGAPVQKSSCESKDSRYRVTTKVADGAHCPGDADKSVAETLPGGATDTLCLDYNWVTGACMNVADGSPKPVDCAVAVPGRVRVVEVKHGTADVNSCSSGDRGFVYSERHFVVCVTPY